MRSSNWFKAESPDDSSDSVVVSFASHWESKIVAGEVSLVFRRRFPKSFQAKRMYLYVGSPRSSLVGVAAIERTEDFSLEDALAECESAAISQVELEKYFKGYEKIGGYHLSDICFFEDALSLAYVSEETGFTPPQSFVRVSKDADQWLMTHGLRK